MVLGTISSNYSLGEVWMCENHFIYLSEESNLGKKKLFTSVQLINKFSNFQSSSPNIMSGNKSSSALLDPVQAAHPRLVLWALSERSLG